MGIVCCLLAQLPITGASERILSSDITNPSPGSTTLSSESSAWSGYGFGIRLSFLLGLLAVELIAVSTWLDTAALTGRSGLIGFVAEWGARLVRSAVVFASILVGFGYLGSRGPVRQLWAKLAHTSIAWGFLLTHTAAMLAFAVLSIRVFSGQSAEWMAAAWLAAGAVGLVSAAFAFLPPGFWWSLLGARWFVLPAAVLISVASSFLENLSRALWSHTAVLTFTIVRALLQPFLSQVVTDTATLMIGSPRFAVTVDQRCSGLEGVGLLFVFMAAWLWFFRDEYRFPQALLAIPGGMLLAWLLNAVRIAALILIGHAGAPAIAAGGFHSQAGWIAFNGIAVAFAVTMRRVPWFSSRELAPAGVRAYNATAVYLAPFLAILTAAMVSRALSSGFEWLYPLRFLAALGVLWHFRHNYSKLDWRFGWSAPLIGCGVFAMWLALDRAAGIPAASPIATGLAHLTQPARVGWIVIRVLAAVITVPIAEELAFRGFLIRRMISPDFESIDPKAFTWIALLVSSLAFGVLHGQRWIAGALAGALYALALLRHGRIGDAIVAHAITNALLAVWVLIGSRWYLW